jgi:hypothetical protein
VARAALPRVWEAPGAGPQHATVESPQLSSARYPDVKSVAADL